MLVAFEKEIGENKGREKRRTWKENKERKLAQKKSRRILERGERPRLTLAYLKDRTRCANCGEQGHWKAECKNPYRSKKDRNKIGNATGGGQEGGLIRVLWQRGGRLRQLLRHRPGACDKRAPQASRRLPPRPEPRRGPGASRQLP